MEPIPLYRARRSRVLGGVCGGIAEYFNIDPTIIRIIAILLPGFNLFGYIIAMIIIPEDPSV